MRASARCFSAAQKHMRRSAPRKEVTKQLALAVSQKEGAHCHRFLRGMGTLTLTESISTEPAAAANSPPSTNVLFMPTLSTMITLAPYGVLRSIHIPCKSSGPSDVRKRPSP